MRIRVSAPNAGRWHLGLWGKRIKVPAGKLEREAAAAQPPPVCAAKQRKALAGILGDRARLVLFPWREENALLDVGQFLRELFNVAVFHDFRLAVVHAGG